MGAMKDLDDIGAVGVKPALWIVLSRRDIQLNDQERARIEATSDPLLLQRWLSRALTVHTAAQLFANMEADLSAARQPPSGSG